MTDVTSIDDNKDLSNQLQETKIEESSGNSDDDHQSIININIGIMGHVDSGKTSLAKVLSTNLSTAALDKSPSSQERGITLDLGFSSFQLSSSESKNIQFTLVDCPGHASLIRTIIGGSQIIDMMFLVIDIMKGIQTQTAECIVIGEITCKRGIIILNKIDQIPIETRQAKIDSVTSKLKKVLEKTCFKDSPMIPFSANPNNTNNDAPIGIELLMKELKRFVTIPKRNDQGDFLFEFDHCFQIKGQGSILTGTVLRGKVDVNQTIQIPILNIEKKVKSMQMFHKPIKRAIQGDRVGICVTQLNAKLLERGLVCSNNSVLYLSSVVISIEKVKFYKNDVTTKSQFHITIGHSTVIATIYLFGNKNNNNNNNGDSNGFDSNKEYIYQDSLFPTSEEYPLGSQFALLKFEHQVFCPIDSIVIGSKLDTNLDTSSCRIAFHGTLLKSVDDSSKKTLFKELKVFKEKSKQGSIDRIHNENTIIGKNLFQKDTDMTSFIGMKIVFEDGTTGILESSFGKTGKVKVYIDKGVPNTLKVNKNNNHNHDDEDDVGENLKKKKGKKTYYCKHVNCKNNGGWRHMTSRSKHYKSYHRDPCLEDCDECNKKSKYISKRQNEVQVFTEMKTIQFLENLKSGGKQIVLKTKRGQIKYVSDGHVVYQGGCKKFDTSVLVQCRHRICNFKISPDEPEGLVSYSNRSRHEKSTHGCGDSCLKCQKSKIEQQLSMHGEYSPDQVALIRDQYRDSGQKYLRLPTTNKPKKG
ncbi:hypothetical protein CYY_009066 [Polysphondylium violaceum]|uniref:Tr-type G domain-containing protein n=1 Tax=Polysphondylium violaceum TaxID=133409 RepID=A0A8J4PM99_9MYCE|nr:hypothetical protein CYY_009066 [Polysphondylium violaceum]